MKYKANPKTWWLRQQFLKLREDHIETLFKLYERYETKHWRSDTIELGLNTSKKQYFFERMFWAFKFINTYSITKQERNKLKSNEKRMVHYCITLRGLKILIELNYKLKTKHIVTVAKDILTE